MKAIAIPAQFKFTLVGDVKSSEFYDNGFKFIVWNDNKCRPYLDEKHWASSGWAIENWNGPLDARAFAQTKRLAKPIIELVRSENA